jgi:hypothetical protein
MIKVADNLRRVILNTQEFLMKEGTWNDKIEEELSNIDAFLDHRVKYEAMGWKRIFKYHQMQSQINDFDDSINRLMCAIRDFVFNSDRIHDTVDSQYFISYHYRIKYNLKIILWAIQDDRRFYLWKIQDLKIRPKKDNTLPRSGQAIKFP